MPFHGDPSASVSLMPGFFLCFGVLWSALGYLPGAGIKGVHHHFPAWFSFDWHRFVVHRVCTQRPEEDVGNPVLRSLPCSLETRPHLLPLTAEPPSRPCTVTFENGALGILVPHLLSLDFTRYTFFVRSVGSVNYQNFM